MQWPEPSAVIRWFEQRYPKPTPAQEGAWPKILAGNHVLIVSPTGTGKTFAAFLAILNALALEAEKGALGGGIQALYISPLRALSYDLDKNLRQPLSEIYGPEPPIRVGLRTGDTPALERRRQFDKPPHILLTTPESLCLLLTQPKWASRLETVRWVIVDEIHALAENKRGAHLTLSLERLAALVRTGKSEQANDWGASPQRIGLSATVAPLDEVSRFLAGEGRPCEIVDVSAAKAIDLRVHSPLGRSPYPPAGYTGVRLMRELGRLIARHRTTLVFTNTRSGAEAATYWLRREVPDLADRIECHHASLDYDVRQAVEDRLKQGELRAVVCSTSLELGIDIGFIDLVVMLSTPKGVSRALQRTGRSGHNIQSVSRGRLMATNLNDLVECCATVLLARARQLDQVRLPTAPLDVLAQHLASMGCQRRWTRAEALALARTAYPYRDLSETEFTEVLDYLAGGGRSLRAQYSELFGKIDLDNEGFETRTGRVRRDLLENIGVIPSEGMIHVRLGRRPLGTIEEGFLRSLQPGDVFILGGRTVRFERLHQMECMVSRAEGSRPTVPRWNSNKMPLTNGVAREIARFRQEMRERLDTLEPERQAPASPTPGMDELTRWIASRLDCGLHNATIIGAMFLAQHRVSEIPEAERLLVETYRSAPGELEAAEGGQPAPRRRRPRAMEEPGLHYFFHTLAGRPANDALSRVVALRLSRLRGGNAIATPDDYGFVLSVRPGREIRGGELPALLAVDGFATDLKEALSRSDLLRYHFRNAAQTGLMVYRNYFGERKALRKVQFSTEVILNVLREHEPGHILLREAWRDAMHSYIDLEGALAFVRRIEACAPRLVDVPCVPPLSFALFATRIKEALQVEDPRETMERLFHHWWSKLQPDAPQEHASPGATQPESEAA